MVKGRRFISCEDILSRTSETDLFKYYINSISFDRAFCSELRKDSKPSCSVKVYNNSVIYTDFATGERFNIFQYVMQKYNVTYNECLNIIANDFGLTSYNRELITPYLGLRSRQMLKGEQPKKQIRIKSVEFDNKDLEYWQQYGIGMEMLNLYNVKSISHYWIDADIYSKSFGQLLFAYCFGDYRYKIYSPLSKMSKWKSSSGVTIQGHEQLDESGDLLFITSSLKDVMTLRVLGYNAVAPSNEGSFIPNITYDLLKERFGRVLIYFNNDHPGLKTAHHFGDRFDLDFIFHPFDVIEKDPSDFYRAYGPEKTKKLIDSLCIK